MEKHIHVKGIKYNLVLKKGKKESIVIKDNDFIITSSKVDLCSYRTLLRRYYKRIVEEEITRLIYDAEFDFKEVNFPKIKVLYTVNRYGQYNKIKNEIQISSIMAKFDLKYIKVVLYHELAHTHYMNHKQDFLDVMESKYPGSVDLDGEFKDFRYQDYL